MTPQILIELIEGAGFVPLPYVGNGADCISIFPEDRVLLALSDIVGIMDETADASELLRKARTETIHGHSVIYWPGMAWPAKR